MRALSETLPVMIEKLKAALSAPSRDDDFTCADCDRWERCGLRPNEPCVARAAQIESGRSRPRRDSASLRW